MFELLYEEEKSGWVQSTGIKRIAAADAPEAFERATKGPVFPDGGDEVVAACRLKSAFRAEPWADGNLVEANEADQQSGWDLQKRFQHDRALISSRGRSSSGSL
jgi:hypothetical protein